MTAALGSLARQYQEFSVENGLASKTADARLLVSAVSPGSIDILLVPDWLVAAATTGPLLMPLIDKAELIAKFAKRIKALIDLFKSNEKKEGLTLNQCNDAINIAAPTAQHGGVQTFNIIKEQHIHPVLVLNVRDARKVVENATHRKAELRVLDAPEKKQRVSMTWSRLDRDETKAKGRTPDRAIIEELDSKPHAVFFTDEMFFLKGEMMADADNPYLQVYFVDVEVSRAAGGKVTAYRVVGYHGKEEV